MPAKASLNIAPVFRTPSPASRLLQGNWVYAKSVADPKNCGSQPAGDAVTTVCQACPGVFRFMDRTASAAAVCSSIGNENRNVAPRPGLSTN